MDLGDSRWQSNASLLSGINSFCHSSSITERKRKGTMYSEERRRRQVAATLRNSFARSGSRDGNAWMPNKRSLYTDVAILDARQCLPSSNALASWRTCPCVHVTSSWHNVVHSLTNQCEWRMPLRLSLCLWSSRLPCRISYKLVKSER